VMVTVRTARIGSVAGSGLEHALANATRAVNKHRLERRVGVEFMGALLGAFTRGLRSVQLRY
jgi:hypothetical protein